MYYIKANGLISSEFSYLFPHTFHQSACHPLHINTRKEKKYLNQKSTGEERNLTGLTNLHSDIRNKMFEAQISFRHL